MIDQLLAFVSQNQNLWGFVALFIGSGLEYVFPPFPGDMLILLGGVLVVASDWSVVFVMSAVTLGSVAGALLSYQFGRWITAHPDSRIARWLRKPGRVDRVERVLAGFRRHGAVYLSINRFLPGIRAFIFVAAGISGLRAASVALWALLSAGVWNALILAAGWLVGGNLARLEALARRYTITAWSALGLVALFFLTRALLRWRRDRQRLEEEAQVVQAPDPSTRRDAATSSAPAARADDGGDGVSREP